jgi:hypothetical protein
VGGLDDLPVHLSDAERRRLEVAQPPPTEEEQLAGATPAADADGQGDAASRQAPPQPR